MKQIISAIRMLVVLTILTGVIYPLVITLAGELLFPTQANGSLVTKGGAVVGSSLIGQANDDPAYFWNRPSAIDYNPLPSGGSNLAPTSATLQTVVEERATAIRAANDLPEDAAIPQDLLFASGSGLDPHISPDAARLQIARVAEARGLGIAQVTELVEKAIEPPQFGILGQPRVNVLLLNLALDQT